MFKIGDKVRVVTDRYKDMLSYGIGVGDIGTVFNTESRNMPGVRFEYDKSFRYGKDCTYYFYNKDLELYCNFKDVCQKILDGIS